MRPSHTAEFIGNVFISHVAKNFTESRFYPHRPKKTWDQKCALCAFSSLFTYVPHRSVLQLAALHRVLQKKQLFLLEIGPKKSRWFAHICLCPRRDSLPTSMGTVNTAGERRGCRELPLSPAELATWVQPLLLIVNRRSSATSSSRFVGFSASTNVVHLFLYNSSWTDYSPRGWLPRQLYNVVSIWLTLLDRSPVPVATAAGLVVCYYYYCCYSTVCWRSSRRNSKKAWDKGMTTKTITNNINRRSGDYPLHLCNNGYSYKKSFCRWLRNDVIPC